MAMHAFETTGFDVYPAPENELSPTVSSAGDFVAGKGWSCAKERRLGRPLSPRERQILTLIIDGKTRKEVAYDLEISHSTVRVIYSRAMKKLGGLWQPRNGGG